MQPAEQLFQNLPLGVARPGAARNPRGNEVAERDTLGNEEHAASVVAVTTWLRLVYGSGSGVQVQVQGWGWVRIRVS